MNNLKIRTLIAYDPQWKKMYSEEKNKIKEKLMIKDLVFEHIGSTAIDGMEALPIVDIMIGLFDFDRDIKKIINILKLLNYRETDNYLDIGDRKFFTKTEEDGTRSFTVLIVKKNSLIWRR